MSEPETKTVDARVRSKLRRLRLALRLRVALRGAAWTAGAALLAAWASLALDYGLYRLTMQHLGLPARLLVDAACLGAAAAVAWRQLVGPLLCPLADADLAALVERAHPRLEDRLASAVSFARGPRQWAGASGELVAKVMDEAAQAVRAIRFGSVLRARPAWAAALAAGGLLLVTGVLAWAAPAVAVPWARRNMLLQERSYPKRTHLDVAGGNPIRVLRGDPLVVTATARAGSVAPDHVTFHMRFATQGESSESVPAGGDNRRTYVKSFPMVNEPLTFHVTGNDDRTGEVRVEVVERPELKDLELEVRSPLYTGVPPRKLRRGTATVDMPEDGVVVLTGLATKDLADATVHLDQRPAGACRIAPSGPEAHRRIDGQFAVPAARPYRPCLTLRVALRDTEGFANPKAASFQLNMRADQPPTVHVEAAGMGGEITPVAAVPLAVTARDDYGVGALHVEWSVQSAPRNTRRELLKAYLPPEPQPDELRYPFDLRLLAARGDANAPPLQVGETLRIQAVATDSRPDAAGGAQIAAGNLLTFRIVTADELLARASAEQRLLREQVDRIIETQKDVRQRCRHAAQQAAQATTLALAQRDVAGACDVQQQIEDLLGATVSRLEAILQQLRNNRAVGGADELRLRTGVIAPLRAAARDMAAPLVRRMESARSLADGAALARELTELIAIQDRLIAALEAVVKGMYKVENAQGVESVLRTLIKLGDQVRRTIRAKAPPASGPATMPAEVRP